MKVGNRIGQPPRCGVESIGARKEEEAVPNRGRIGNFFGKLFASKKQMKVVYECGGATLDGCTYNGKEMDGKPHDKDGEMTFMFYPGCEAFYKGEFKHGVVDGEGTLNLFIYNADKLTECADQLKKMSIENVIRFSGKWIDGNLLTIFNASYIHDAPGWIDFSQGACNYHAQKSISKVISNVFIQSNPEFKKDAQSIQPKLLSIFGGLFGNNKNDQATIFKCLFMGMYSQQQKFIIPMLKVKTQMNI